jgi:peptide/nickel transport system substrate-binding protein
VATTGTGRKRMAGIVAFVIGAAVLTACSGADSGSSSSGTLNYGFDFSSQSSGTLDTATSKSNCDGLLMAPIYGSLINVDTKGQLQPGLVKSWDVSADGMTVTLHIRPNVTFQDGTAFDANAVIAGLKHNQLNTDQLTSIQHIKSFDAVDPLTVKLTLKDQTSLLVLYGLNGRDGYIIASNSLNSADTKPIGAGPYSVVSYTPGSAMKLKKYDSYYESSQYPIANIDFKQVGVGPPSVTALQAGAIDYVQVQPEGFDALKGDKKFKVAVQPSTAYLQFEFRQDGPFANQKVRQAIEYAINREEINKTVNYGQGEVASQQFPKSSAAYDPSLVGMYPYNPTKAKELLTEAGYPNGFSTTFVIPGGNIANMERQGALVQKQLADVGITASIERVNGSDIATGYYIGKKGDAFVAEELGDWYTPNKLWDNWGKGQFVAIYDNAERQDITDIGKQAFATTDPAELSKLVKQGEKIVMDEALDVPIAFVPQFAAYNAQRLTGTVRAQTDICNPVDLRGMKLKG